MISATSLLTQPPSAEAAKQMEEDAKLRSSCIWSAWRALKDYQRGRLARLDQLLAEVSRHARELPERDRERLVGKIMLATVGMARPKRGRGRWPIERWEENLIHTTVQIFSKTVDPKTGKKYPLELDYDHKGKAGETAFQAAAALCRDIRKIKSARAASIYYKVENGT